MTGLTLTITPPVRSAGRIFPNESTLTASKSTS
jgi:hypothetical protein